MSEYAVKTEDALARLEVIEDYDPGDGPKPCVHTFVQSAFGLLGAHWALDDVKAHIEKHGVEESGELASGMGHGLVVLEPGRGPLFLATVKPESDDA